MDDIFIIPRAPEMSGTLEPAEKKQEVDAVVALV